MPKKKTAPATATPDFRQMLGEIMTATVSDEQANHDWHYHAVRPMAVPPTWHPGQLVTGDCSKGYQYLNRWVGAPDPMHELYGPYGNSQTLWASLPHLVSARDLLVGDCVTFGFDGEEHAAGVKEAASAANGWDPLLWSFGHEGAPNFYRLSQDHREAQFLRNPLPVFVPTPAQECRFRTGWFAWVSWKLGEGDWRAYGRSDRTVRPNVPKVIPLGWWQRYAKFLARRHHGNPKPAAPGPASTV
jgi:hypothetical protein